MHLKRMSIIVIILNSLLIIPDVAAKEIEQQSDFQGYFSDQKKLGTPLDTGIWVLERYDPIHPENPPRKSFYYIEKYGFGPMELYIFMNGTKPKSHRKKMAVWFKDEQVLLMQVPSPRVGMQEDLICKKASETNFDCLTFSMPEFYIPEYFRPETEFYYKKRIIRPELQFKYSEDYIKQIIQPLRYVLRKVE